MTARDPVRPVSAIGREREIETLARFLNGIPDGPCILTISGKPGIGKSTVWLEGLRLARQLDLSVHVHRADASEAKLAFQGLSDLFEPSLDDLVSSLPALQARALEVALLRAEDDASPAEPRALSMATLSFLRALSSSAPTLLAIDDVQWLDDPSARALRFALRRLDREPVGLLLTLRDSETEPADGSLPLLDDRGDVPSQTIRAEGLGLDAIDDILGQRVGLELPRPKLKELHRITQGNPLFAIELGRAVARAGGIHAGQLPPVPGGIDSVLRARIEALPEQTQRVLESLSAMARPKLEVLRAVTASEPFLDPALDARILDPDPRQLRFSHPLYGIVIYGGLPPSRKRQIHRSLADATDDPEQRARHLALAASGPDGAVATALERAADSTWRRGAPEEAADMLEFAVAMTPEEEQGKRRVRVRRCAEAHFLSGDSDRARRLLEDELSTAPGGIERAKLLLPLASLENQLSTAAALLEEASELAHGDDETMLHCAYKLSRLHYNRGDVSGAMRSAQAARELAERLGDDAWLALTLTNLAVYRFLAGEGLDAEGLERALAFESRAPAHPAFVDEGYFYESPGTWLGCLLMWSGDLDGARTRLETSRKRALDHGDESSALGLLLHLTELECLSGNLDRARRLAETFARVNLREGIQTEVTGYVLSLAYAHLGLVDEARAAVERGLRISRETEDVIVEALCSRTQGFLDVSMGALSAARTPLERAAECVEAIGLVEPCVVPYLPDLIEVLIGDSEDRRAELLIQELEERGRRLDRPWALAAAARCRALLLGRAGSLPEATEAAEAALKHLSRLPSPHPMEQARALLVLGALRRRARQKKAAREALDEALRIFGQMGAKLWASKAEAELTRIGGRAPAPLELTPSEERVAELVVAGLTNREIAEELFVSVRTVESTLSKAFRKVGVTSRRELRKLPRFSGRSPR